MPGYRHVVTITYVIELFWELLYSYLDYVGATARLPCLVRYLGIEELVPRV